MALYVHHGSRLADLADTLAELLGDPLDDPFEAEVIAVPTAGVRDYLIRRLAARLGVAANIAWHFPARFVDAALGGRVDDPWALDRLTFAVLAELRTGAVAMPREQAGAAAHQYRTARRIADRFDRYGVHRPAMLQAWCAGEPTDGIVETDPDGRASSAALPPAGRWQYELWTRLATSIGEPDPGTWLAERIAAIRSGAIEVVLPERVAWVGMSAIPPARLAVLGAVAQQRDVHLLIVRPSATVWERATALPAVLTPRRSFVDQERVVHPLSRSWGAPATEMAALVNGLSGAVVSAVDRIERASSPRTLLGQLQHDIDADRPPSRVNAGVAGDGSVQVHACHGPTRQLEVLRDALAARFSADPSLRPEDVIILTPDVARFAPSAAAVFGRSVVPLPVVVSDLSLTSTTPVAEALGEVVRLASSRCRAGEIVALLGRAPVRLRFGLSPHDVDQIADWARALATSWGLSTDHRAQWLGDEAEITIGSWRATVDALLAGALMSAPEPRRAFGELTPFDDITPVGAVVAGRLADALARLDDARRQLAAERSVAEWCDVLAELLGAFCATEPDDRWQLEAVLAALERVRDASAATPTPVAGAEVGDLLADALDDERGRLRLGTGRITLTGLVPLRNVPARIVALLGFDDELLGVGAPDRDDLLAVRPCVGENDPRMERRQAILDALLAAGDAVIITCDGQDRTTNRRRQFAVPLAELLETITAMDPTAVHGDDPQVVVRHPLRAHDPRNFTPGAVGGVASFGFDETALRMAYRATAPTVGGPAAPGDDAPSRADAPRGARASGAAATVDEPDAIDEPHGSDGWALARTVPAAATLADLTRSLTRPHLTYLRHGLDVALPREPEAADESIPLWLDRLGQVGRGRDLVEMLRQAAGRGGASDWDALVADVVQRWRSTAALRADIPPRRLATSVLDAVEAEVLATLAAIADAAVTRSPVDFLAAGETTEIDLHIAPVDLAGSTGTHGAEVAALRVRDHVLSVADDSGRRWICTFEYAALRDRYLMRAALDVAAAMVGTGSVDWAAALAVRSTGKAPGVIVVDPRARHDDPAACRAAADQLLAVAAGVHLLAISDRLALFETCSRPLAGGVPLDEDKLWGTPYSSGDLASPEARFVWGDTTLRELLDRRPSPVQLAELVWGAFDDFVVAEPVVGSAS